MATMPTIDLGTRRLSEGGSFQVPHLDAPTVANAAALEKSARAGNAARTAGTLAKGLDRVGDAMIRLGYVMDRADEREADYAVRLADDFMRNGTQGVDAQDPATGRTVHTPGVFERDYESFRQDGTDAVRETETLMREMRQGEFYTKLTSAQREKFERKWKLHENGWRRAAADVHGRLAENHAKQQTLGLIEAENGDVAKAYFADGATFAKVADAKAARVFALSLGTTLKHRELLDDPGVTFERIADAEKWDDTTRDLNRRKWEQIRVGYDLGRVDAMIAAASNDQSAGGATPEQLLATAGQIAANLNGAKSYGKDGKVTGMLGREMISDDQRNAIFAKIEKAGHEMMRTRSNRFAQNAKAISGEIDKVQWSMAENPSAAKFDDAGFVDGLKKQVLARQISPAQATALFARYKKLHSDRDAMEDAMRNPSQFAAKSDLNTWLDINLKIANAERDGTSAASIEAAVEGAKPYLTQKDYFSLWTDARKKHDAEDDRVVSQVFGEFLKIDNETASVLTDPTKRGNKAWNDAFDTASGSSNAEYVQDGKWYNPDFTHEDVVAAVDVVRKYVKANPDNAEGAKQLLDSLVNPFAEKARAIGFRDRITELLKSGQWNVSEAFK